MQVLSKWWDQHKKSPVLLHHPNSDQKFWWSNVLGGESLDDQWTENYLLDLWRVTIAWNFIAEIYTSFLGKPQKSLSCWRSYEPCKLQFKSRSKGYPALLKKSRQGSSFWKKKTIDVLSKRVIWKRIGTWTQLEKIQKIRLLSWV